MSISPLHEAALNYASSGVPVFPCAPNGKKPITPHGHKDATTDVNQINAWWTEFPEANVGMCPEDIGQCVIDIDRGAHITATSEFPVTREIETPRGGYHLYYKGSLPPTVNRLGDKIDTRGKHSYVLVPPSVVDGKPYKVLHDRPVQALPSAIATRLNVANQPTQATNTELDGDGNVSRARNLLDHCVRQGDVAVSGRGGNNRSYRLAAEIQALGISQETCVQLLEELWNPHCRPPWSHEELERLVANASEYMQNEAGAFAVGSAEEVFAEAKIEDKPPIRSRFYFEDDAEQDLAPDPEWLIPELIPDRATVLMIGHSGCFKSYLTQDILLAVASDRPTFGYRPCRLGPTFYAAHEVRDDIRKPRKQAWKVAREISGTIPFFVARGPHVISDEECEEFREQIRVRLRQSAHKIGAIALDTVAKCMTGLNENDAGDTGRFIGFVDSLRDEFECPVICLHHFGKDEGRGGRGSSALQAGFDTTLSVNRFGKTTLVSVKVVQHATAPEREEPFYFEGQAVGRSLVFQPITASEHRAATGKDDQLSARRIGAALKSLEAIGSTQSVSTVVLASALVPPDEIDTVEQRQEQIERMARALATLSRSKLEAYCTRQGRTVLWHLP